MTTHRQKSKNEKQSRVTVFIPFVCEKCGSLDIEILQNLNKFKQKVLKTVSIPDKGKEAFIGIDEEIVSGAFAKCGSCGKQSILEVFSFVKLSEEELENFKASDVTLERLKTKYPTKKFRKKPLKSSSLEEEKFSLKELFKVR